MTSLQNLDTEALFDRLYDVVSTEKYHKAVGREGLAATYRPLISETCDEIKARGGDVLEWLDAVSA